MKVELNIASKIIGYINNSILHRDGQAHMPTAKPGKLFKLRISY